MHTALERCALGTDPGTLSGGESSRRSPGPQADSFAQSARRCTVDTEHRCAMAHVAAVLSELQNRASAFSAMVSQRCVAQRVDGSCQ